MILEFMQFFAPYGRGAVEKKLTTDFADGHG